MQQQGRGKNRPMSLPVVLYYNQEIANFSKQKQYNQACQSFERMLESNVKPDVVTYNTMINVYVKSQRLNEAFMLFDQMKKENINPTIITYTSLIDGCGKCNNLKRAMQLYDDVKKMKIPLNMHFFNAYINAAFINGSLQYVDSILNDIKTMGLQPNTVTYNTMLNGYIKINLLSRLKPTIEDMIANKVAFSNVTQATILQASQLVTDQNSLSEFADLINTSKINPTKAQATQLILDMVSSRRLILAQQLLDFLIRKGCQISEEAFVSLIGLAGEFSNIKAIQWCSENAASFGYNVSFHVYIAQFCLFARFNNYEKTLQAYDNIRHNKLFIPPHIMLSVLTCFLNHKDIVRSKQVAEEWINSESKAFTSSDADELCHIFYQYQLYEEILYISRLIRDIRNIKLGTRASNYTILSAINCTQFGYLISAISELSPSCDIIVQIVSTMPQTDLHSVNWTALIDNCSTSTLLVSKPPQSIPTTSSQSSQSATMSTSSSTFSLASSATFTGPSPELLCELMEAFMSRNINDAAWCAFRRFTMVGTIISEDLLQRAIKVVPKNDQECIMYLVNCAKQNDLDIPEFLYTLGVDTSIKNGDYATAVSLKLEMDSYGYVLPEPTKFLFDQNYEYIKSALPSVTPPAIRKSRTRSRTMPVKSTIPSYMTNITEGMEEISKRSVMMVLDGY